MTAARDFLDALSPAKRRALATRMASAEFRATAAALLERQRAGEVLTMAAVAEDLKIPKILVASWFGQVAAARHGVITAIMSADA